MGGGTPPEADPGVEIVVVADSQGRGVYVTCGAHVDPVNLVAGLCDLMEQITRAVVARPHVTRAGDLGLGEDVPF